MPKESLVEKIEEEKAVEVERKDADLEQNVNQETDENAVEQEKPKELVDEGVEDV